MEKIAIKGSGGGGGGGTTFEVVATPTIVMSSSGGDVWDLNNSGNDFAPCFNLIGGQPLGIIGSGGVDFTTASKCTHSCIIYDGLIYFYIGDVSYDVGSSLLFKIDIIDNNAQLLESMNFETVGGNEVLSWQLQSWDGDLTNKQLTLLVYSKQSEGYTNASIVINGWSFAII